MQALLMSDRLWILMPCGDFTNRVRADAFESITAAAAMAQKFLVDRHEATPFLAFLILEDPAVAARLDGERRCMLDPWSAQLSDESGGFTTPLARAKVFLIALMVHFSNMRLEVGNAALRRWVTKRVQTHKLSLADLSAEWTASQFRVQMPAPQVVPVPETDAAVPEEGGARASGSCGGPWRAYVRQQASSDLRAVAERYRALGPAELEALREEGAQARDAARRGVAQGTSFGPKRAEIARATRQRLAESRLARLDGAVGKLSVDTVLAVADTLARSPSEVVKELRAMNKLANRAEREEEESDRLALVEYDAEHSARYREQLVPHAPHAKCVAESLVAVPASSDHPVVELAPERTASVVDSMFAWEQDHLRKTNLLSTSAAVWERLHNIVPAKAVSEATMEDDEEPAEEYPLSKCWVAGVCLCTPDGKRLFRLRNAWLRILKQACPRLNPEHKELLARGRVFCKVILTPVFADGSPRDALFWGTDPVWFQIARMQFSPYTPRLHRMLEIAPEDEQFEMANAAGDETVLKAIS